MIEIPIQPSISADQTMRIELAGVMVNIRFYYNTRSRHWMLDVANDMGKGMQGIKLVTNYPLFTQYAAQNPFVGDLLLLAKDETAPKEPSYDDLGSRWGLFYLNANELAQWRLFYGLG